MGALRLFPQPLGATGCRGSQPPADSFALSIFVTTSLFDKLSLSEKQAVTVYAKSSTVSSVFMHQVPLFSNFSRLSFSPPAFVLFHVTIVLALFCISGSFLFSLFIFLLPSALLFFVGFFGFFFTSLTCISFQFTSLSLFLCASSRLRSLSFQLPVTHTHIVCNNLLPIALKCTQSHRHVENAPGAPCATRARAHLLGKRQRGREANRTSSPSPFSQV